MSEARCTLCGEPMPAGEEMFAYHGYSGDCPKPPLPKPKVEVVAEYSFLDDLNGGLWIDVQVDRKPHDRIGPFQTAGERQSALNDLLGMMRSRGAKDLPATPQ